MDLNFHLGLKSKGYIFNHKGIDRLFMWRFVQPLLVSMGSYTIYRLCSECEFCLL